MKNEGTYARTLLPTVAIRDVQEPILSLPRAQWKYSEVNTVGTANYINDLW